MENFGFQPVSLVDRFLYEQYGLAELDVEVQVCKAPAKKLASKETMT